MSSELADTEWAGGFVLHKDTRMALEHNPQVDPFWMVTAHSRYNLNGQMDIGRATISHQANQSAFKCFNIVLVIMCVVVIGLFSTR